MPPSYNLLILHTPDLQASSDWITVRDKIQERAPDVEVRIADSSSRNSVTRRWQVTRPSLVFSASGLYDYRPAGGTIIASSNIPAAEQYSRLTAAGVSVTRTIGLTPGMLLKPEIWGEYVIAKPYGNRAGSDLRLVRTTDVGPRYLALTNNHANRLLIKRYIHSVDERGYPVEYRVLTMFGSVLYAARIRSLEKRPPLAEFAKDFRGISSSDDARVKRHRTLAYEADVLQLARSAAAVFPEAACLGIDILRDSQTGELFVIEANSGGHIWHFSSKRSESYDPAFRRSLYAQFNGLDLVADLLIEKTRNEAS
jgi:hypothetical protein